MRISNYREYASEPLSGDQPEILWGTEAVDGDAGIWKDAPIGSLYVRSSAGAVNLYLKTTHVPEDADWDAADFAVSNAIGYIPVPLATLLEVQSNAVVGPVKMATTKKIPLSLNDIREVASNNFLNAAGNGGILATDTTPILQYTNGDTDSAARLNWAGGNSDPIALQFTLPEDYDEASAVTLKFLAAMAGATNTPTLSVDWFVDVGDTKVTAATAGVTGTSPAVYTSTLTAADVPAIAAATGKTVSVEITPGAHAADALYVYAVWAEYTTDATPKLATTNGDTDSALTLTWAAADVTPVVFQVPLPPDLDDTADLTVHFRIKSAGSSDTPILSLDSYFNEGDTKVEDDTAASTNAWTEKIATIGNADVPSGAQTLTVEVTPAAHGTDALSISAVWCEYVRT